MALTAGEIAKAGKSALDYYASKKPTDQITTERPFLKKLVAKKKAFPGAKQFINEKLLTNYGSNFQWFWGDQTVTYNSRDVLADANFSYRAFHDGFTVSEHELRQNGIVVNDSRKPGSAASADEIKLIADYFALQMDALQMGVEARLDMELHRSGAQSAEAPAGLDALVSLAPATGTVGGIDRATNPYWRNHASTGIAAASLLAKMDIAWRACIRNGGKPDFIMAGEDFIDAYRAAALAAGKQIVIQAGSNSVEGSTPEFLYMGVPVVWNPVFDDLDALESPTITWSKRCYFLNTNHLRLRDADGDWMQPRDPKRDPDKYVHKFAITGTLGMTMNRANAHAVLSIS